MKRNPACHLALIVGAALLPGCGPAALEHDDPFHTPPDSVAFTIPEPDLVPEGIAYDPVSRSFFVSSTYLRKVVRVDREGRARDFIPTARDGLLGALGMKVDAERRLLWIASSDAGPGMPMIEHDDWPRGSSALHAYNLDTGALVQKHVLRDSTGHFLNDLALDDSGRVYVTDTGARALYATRPGATGLERFVDLRDHGAPNGIVALHGGDLLIVAVPDGFVRVDTENGDVSRIPLDPGVTVNYVDGLALHDGRLVAVEPFRSGSEVGSYALDAHGTRVTAYERIAGGHPATDQPTTGVVVGNSLYYILNSQLRTFRMALEAGQRPQLRAPAIARVRITGN